MKLARGKKYGHERNSEISFRNEVVSGFIEDNYVYLVLELHEHVLTWNFQVIAN